MTPPPPPAWVMQPPHDLPKQLNKIIYVSSK
ncbi:lysis system o-spanin lipoprotein Rz1 [Proteus mirabilis]